MHSAFILVSDRVSNGEKQDKITPIVGERLAAAGAPTYPLRPGRGAPPP